MTNLIIILVLIGVGYLIGTLNEKKHFRSIEKREKLSARLPVVTMDKSIRGGEVVTSARMVTGNAVISIDYFKRILAALRNLFGGEVAAYESLLDRARREALLRMKYQVPSAHAIVNVRIETSAIGNSANQKNALGSVEALAYGTAVWFEEKRN
ncbi:MAG: heavy metal-binding domain-containing protein [Chitinispirillaceae bacterium]|nr:heavy metal-binding domain-containing protein [Chitinispirillaceae bacterium]